jgi:vesicle-fusing ATPase
MAGISDDIENLRVNMGDFERALDEVHPAFGVAEEELAQVIQNGIIHFDKGVDVRPDSCVFGLELMLDCI